MSIDTYTDAKLQAEIDDYDSGRTSLPGFARQAQHLLRVPQEVRVEVSLLGNYLVNTVPGYRPSDATLTAVMIFEDEGIEGVRRRSEDR